MVDSQRDCNFPFSLQQFMDPTLPAFPAHVLTPTFRILAGLILLHTSASFTYKLSYGSCTSWLHGYLTTPLRKKLSIALSTFILAIQLYKGYYIITTDMALWAKLIGAPPSLVPHKENLAEWVDRLDGVVACSIPIGVTLVLGLWILVMQWVCLGELVALDGTRRMLCL
ncbi:hypothetical protein BJX66DRAFT_301892 [Aspergillus keveii]|uniref:Uncharacterized protein n=1 Tax=Aspergillus keveii TaxID=714993 RepID=A0ABR4G956_9EURO